MTEVQASGPRSGARPVVEVRARVVEMGVVVAGTTQGAEAAGSAVLLVMGEEAEAVVARRGTVVTTVMRGVARAVVGPAARLEVMSSA